MPPAIKPSLALIITVIISVFLLAEGVWGMFRPVVFGVLTTNTAHAIIHIVLGLAGLIAHWRSHIKGYFGFLGSLLVVVSLLWLVPVTRAVPQDLLNLNWAGTALNLVMGIVSLVVAFTETSRRRFGVPGTTSNPPMKVARKPRKAA